MKALLVLLLVLTTSVLARLTTQDAAKSVHLINNERARFKLPKVTYNLTMQRELEQVDKTYWFSKSLNMTHEFYLGKQLRVRPYNLYFHNATQPFRYLFHDTVETEMWRIVNYRAKQRQFFKKNKCSPNPPFTMFYSCGGKANQIADSTPGSWWFHYYPRMILKSLKQVACILPDITGPNVPAKLKGKQKKVFICFGDHSGNITTDNPLGN